MKTDAQLKKDVQAELEWEPSINATRIGVLGLLNKVKLREREAPDYVAHRIHEALARYAEDEATHIEVLVEGSSATLRGSVNSWAERGIVQNAAWSAPGIQRVFNELKVLS